jgi:UDP-glucose 4-epimerase
VGSGRDTTINELASLVADVVGKEAEVLHSPAESGGVARLCADISAARRLLGYEPKIDLRKGLRLTLDRDPRFQT